jgi:hypothetical protein
MKSSNPTFMCKKETKSPLGLKMLISSPDVDLMHNNYLDAAYNPLMKCSPSKLNLCP